MISVTMGELSKALMNYPTVNFPSSVSVGSWRGNYGELAIGNYGWGHGDSATTSKELGVLLKNSIGKVFRGYKGGDFRMHEDTEVHLSDYGSSGRGDDAIWLGQVLLSALGACHEN